MKVANGVFRRFHSLDAPAPEDELPILIEENPSRDFFFPLSGAEVVETLGKLPEEDVEAITHVWLRRVSNREYEDSKLPLASYICGGGVQLIVLYPWPKDMRLTLGSKKPSARTQKTYSRWAELIERSSGWFFQFDLEGLRRFYVEHLLFHEVGHHVDHYRRHFSRANEKQVEEFADQYAMSMSAVATSVFDSLKEAEG